MRKSIPVCLGIISLFLFACSPKVVPPATTTATEPTAPKKSGPCGTFDESADEETALNAHVIYRDFLKQEDYKQAYNYWRTAYRLAPAADGHRNTHFADGIRFYEYFMENTADEAKKAAYVDSIFLMYDHIEQCFGELGYVAGRKAFDLYYKYKDRAEQDEIFTLFKKSMDADPKEAPLFILNPFTDLLVRRYFDDKVDLSEAQKYEQLIRARLLAGLESGENKEQWQIINEYVPERLEAFEGVKGFYDCDYYIAKYIPVYQMDTANCEVIGEVYGRLRWGGCDTSSMEINLLADAGRRHCMTEATPTESAMAYKALRDGNYEEAVTRFQEAASNAEDRDKKANYLLLVSKIYYRDLKNFPLSRQFALQAAESRPNWGEPFLLIGRLYASSGPLCGPGRGWDSQIVVWPAIDKWNYAKRIDPEAAEEANKWINTYAKYMPSKEDVFQRNLQEGGSFRVGCWIQENTTIRAAKN
ncbi:MAG: hypothetical protein KDC53_10970 [Saprospiraceae bacterium]|nr:hypothetical protein [Saprospiraceae bacterium]